MTKDKWIQEARSQIIGFESQIKYLKSCGPDDYEQDRFFQLKDMINNCKKQVKFLKDGIYLIEQLDSIIPSNY